MIVKIISKLKLNEMFYTPTDTPCKSRRWMSVSSFHTFIYILFNDPRYMCLFCLLPGCGWWRSLRWLEDAGVSKETLKALKQLSFVKLKWNEWSGRIIERRRNGEIEKRKKFVDSWLFKIINIPKKTTSKCRNHPPTTFAGIHWRPPSLNRAISFSPHDFQLGFSFYWKLKGTWHSFSIHPIELWVSLLGVPGGDWYYFAGWGGRQATRLVLKNIYSSGFPHPHHILLSIPKYLLCRYNHFGQWNRVERGGILSLWWFQFNIRNNGNNFAVNFKFKFLI